MTLYEGAAFKKALSSGGAILTVRTHNDEEAKRAEKVLAKHNPVDIEARGAGLIAEHRALGDVKDEVLKLAEEQLDVGKRSVETGRTRIRRYAVKRPVRRSRSSASTSRAESGNRSARAARETNAPGDARGIYTSTSVRSSAITSRPRKSRDTSSRRRPIIESSARGR